MTTGSRTSDLTYTLQTQSGPSWGGRYWSKVWNGGDRTPSAPGPLPQYTMITRTRYRVVVKNQKIVSRLTRPRAVTVTKWVPVTTPTLVTKRKVGKGAHQVIVRRKSYKPVTYTRWFGGDKYYKILPEKVTVKSSEKVYRKKIRYYPPRSSWGEHAYTMTLQRRRQGLSFKEVWVNYPSYPQNWVEYSTTPEGECGLPGSHQEWNDNDMLKLIGRLRQSLLGSDFHAGKLLAEGRQTVRMIGDVARRIAMSYILAKRGQWLASFRTLSNARATKGTQRRYSRDALDSRNSPGKGFRSDDPQFSGSGTSANLWLEWSYGVKPLLQDVKTGAEALAHQLNVPVRKKYRVVLRTPGSVGVSPVYQWVGGCYTSCQIVAVVSETDIPQLSGLTDIASGVWEATPWSFVADWFVPIGAYLEARGFAQAIRGDFITTKKVVSWSGSPSVKDVPGMNVRFKGDWDHERFDLVLTRTVGQSLGVPLPTVVPLKDVFQSWQRTTNAVALLIQTLRK